LQQRRARALHRSGSLHLRLRPEGARRIERIVPAKAFDRDDLTHTVGTLLDRSNRNRRSAAA